MQEPTIVSAFESRQHDKFKKLSARQERKLLGYIEDKFLDITRNFKKRSDPSSSLPTLAAYLKETHSLLSLILQIPPTDNQKALRTALLLRLTGDFLASVPGYTPDSESLPDLVEWLDELDCGWLAVLRSQVWDPETAEGVDFPTALASADSGPQHARISESSISGGEPTSAASVSQTDRTRLRSIFVSGSERLEEWLEGLHVDGAQDVESALELLGLRQEFEELFYGSLSEMGELSPA